MEHYSRHVARPQEAVDKVFEHAAFMVGKLAWPHGTYRFAAADGATRVLRDAAVMAGW